MYFLRNCYVEITIFYIELTIPCVGIIIYYMYEELIIAYVGPTISYTPV